MRDAEDRPCHKTCAETQQPETEQADAAAAATDLGVSIVETSATSVMNELMRAALDAADRGWHVFPVRPNNKRPAFPDHPAETCRGRDPRCRAAGAHVG